MTIHKTPAMDLLAYILRHKLAATLLLFVLTAAALSQISGINLSVDMKDFFVSSDPILENNEKLKQFFSNSDFIGVLVESENVFDRETLETIRDVGNKLKENVPLATSVISITELDNFPLGGEWLRFNDNKLESSEQEIDEIVSYYSSIPSIGGTLFSLDYDEAWIIVQLAPYTDEWNQISVGETAYKILSGIDSGKAHLTGTGIPVYAYRKQSEMMMDLTKMLIIGAIAALILSAFILRSFRGVAGAILIILISVLIVFGMQGWLNTTIDSAFISVPILLTMGVSIGYTVHITRFFLMYLKSQGDRHKAVLYAVQESGKPILFTAFTTIAALYSFTIVEIRPIQWVGMTSAYSIFIVCILTLVFYPVLLSLGKDIEPVESNEKRARFEPLMEKIPAIIETKSKLIFLIFFLSIIISAFGVTKLEIDFNGIKMMGDRLDHMKDQIHIAESDIASGETLEIIIEMPRESFKKLNNLKNLEKIEKELKNYPHVKDSNSLAEVIKEFNYIRYGRKDDSYIIPEKESLVRGLLLYYERLSPEALRPWINEDYGTARIFIELDEFSSKEIEQLVLTTEKLVEKYFTEDATYFLSGSSYEMAVMNQHITRGLVRSVLIATAMIAFLLIFLFKSVKLGLVAMIPNIYPLLICGAIMGFAGIPMEFVTMTVAPMIMGLAVDDTIHFISHIRKDLKLTGNPDTSIRFAFRTVGTAISETTVILCLTFMVFIVSDINSVRNMGLLSAAGMMAAYGADIFITPLLIKRFYKKK